MIGSFEFSVIVPYRSRAPTQEEVSAIRTCPICQESFTNPTALQCRHVFCEECIAEWLVYNNILAKNLRLADQKTCPMCRSVVENGGYAHGYNGATTSAVPYL